MRIYAAILTAILSTACLTVRVDIPDGLELAKTSRGTWRVELPKTEAKEAPRAVSAPPRATPKRVVKKVKRAAKPTAESCKALREVADSCDAQLKVEECKTSCEPKPVETSK
jgi:hypothetical protein